MADVAGWPATMRRPSITLSSDAPAPQMIEALARGLDGAGFTITRRSSEGFRARRTRWWGLLAAEAPTTTTLEVRATTGGVEITTDATWLESRVSQRAGRGLTSATAALRNQGYEVRPVDQRGLMPRPRTIAAHRHPRDLHPPRRPPSPS